MSSELIQIIAMVSGLLGGSSVIYLLVQTYLQRKKNKIDYGDNLLEVTNKMSESLREAHVTLAALQHEMKTAADEHEEEVKAQEKRWQEQQKALDDTWKAKQEATETSWNERQARLKARIQELEKVIINYEISFTLTTHPLVQVSNLKVIGKDDALVAMQKMTPEGTDQNKAINR